VAQFENQTLSNTRRKGFAGGSAFHHEDGDRHQSGNRVEPSGMGSFTKLSEPKANISGCEPLQSHMWRRLIPQASMPTRHPVSKALKRAASERQRWQASTAENRTARVPASCIHDVKVSEEAKGAGWLQDQLWSFKLHQYPTLDLSKTPRNPRITSICLILLSLFSNDEYQASSGMSTSCL
jgi:hypothetical protein